MVARENDDIYLVRNLNTYVVVSLFGYGVGVFFVNVISAFVMGRRAEGNYWGEGATTLEWTLSSPPPFHQFETLPVIK